MMDFPEPLFESFYEVGERLCLVCAKKRAYSILRTTSKPVVPLCRDCAADWNFYGYLILKRIKPLSLVVSVLKFKVFHPFQKPYLFAIWNDVKTLQEWGTNMKKFSKYL